VLVRVPEFELCCVALALVVAGAVTPIAALFPTFCGGVADKVEGGERVGEGIGAGVTVVVAG
jgi:hypothetical protein